MTGRTVRRSVAAVGELWQAFLRRTKALAPATMVALLLGALALVFNLTPQGRDVVAAQFNETSGSGPLLVLGLALALCSFVAWAVSRKAVIDAFGPDPKRWGDTRRWPGRLRRQWLLQMPRLLCVLPFLILIWPLWRVPGATFNMLLNVALAALAAIVLAFILLWVLRRRRPRLFCEMENEWHGFPWLWGIGPVAGIGLVMLWVLLVSKVDAPRWIGAPALALFAAAFVAATLGFLYHLAMFKHPDLAGIDDETARKLAGQKGGVRFLPLLGLLALWAVACSWFNDNHSVAGRTTVALGPATRRANLDDTIERFVEQVPRDTARAVPIIFVATAGGASRAAYWTGEVLGKLEQDSGGRFGRHVFALSSVSAGTLGAATYLAERAEATSHKVITTRMRVENGADHLSPTIAGLLFPDLLQRFLPLPWFPDRAEYLERSFEASWTPQPGERVACRPNGERRRSASKMPVAGRFERPMLELWSCSALNKVGGKPVWVPALLANGTRAEDGRRIVTSSIDLPTGTLRDALDFHTLFGTDVPLSVVVTNSARFPVVSPPGTLPRSPSGGTYGHILDGGYFENGGIATAVELMQAVQRRLASRHREVRFRYVLLEINNDDGGDPRRRALEIDKDAPGEPPREVAPLRGVDALLPVFGLYQTRGARGTLEALRTRHAMKEAEEAAAAKEPATLAVPGDNYILFQLCRLWRNDHLYRTEMNWALSSAARDRLNHALAGDRTDPACGWQEQLNKVGRLLAKSGSAVSTRDSPARRQAAGGRRRSS